ncbi:uncharacterized protein LOC110456428 isoform X2 [Mizuhopecten yessoensis]|uniref:uncharacterized protein LOC110456428 isoform X2 n=1 Tax=Mizuhopecten yessoensis TaxID=6573 RepID=UPI000B45E81D|nr:uncharacterized protein LOC110456428 isoform X2 [Mizuhopecten yessoensis]
MEDQDDTLASLDLYDDLITDEGLSRQYNYDELSRKYDAAVLKITELESKVDTLQKSESKLSKNCEILEKNISTLFLTARLELQRKDRAIQQYKHMREPRKQTRIAPASNPRLNRDDERNHWEHSKKASDSILVDKVKTKRRLSSDDHEEKIKKKRKLSDKTGNYGEENASKCNNASTRTDNCGQNAARKILEKSRKDFQRRLSGGKSSTHAYDEHDQNTEREKKKGNKEGECSANELRKAERNDRREKRRKNTVENEKRDETKTKDNRIKTTSENVHFVEENRNKIAASGGVCDLREKLKMKRLRDEENFKKANLLDSKRNPCNILKVDSKSYSPEEKTKSLGDISSPKNNNRPSHTNRNRSGNRSSEEHSSPRVGLLAKSCDTKGSDQELKKKVYHLSPISKPRSDRNKQVNENRKSSADTKSSLDSERLKSQSNSSQGVVASDQIHTGKKLHYEKPSYPVTHEKKTSSLETPLPDQVTNSFEKCSSPKVKDVLTSVSKKNASSLSYLERANETSTVSKKSKKESADNRVPSSVERTSSELPLQETDEENISSKTILPVEAIQTGGKLKDAPTTGQVRKNDQDKQQKLHLFSVGNVKSEEMSTVHISEPVLGSPVLDRKHRKSREFSLSASSVLEEGGTNDTHIQSATQEMCLINVKLVESRETTHPMESCARARHHSKEKLAEKEKHEQETASHRKPQTKLVDVKKEQGNRQTDTTTYADKTNEKHQVNVDYEHESQRQDRKLENSLKMDIDELKKIIKTDPEVNKLQSVPDRQTTSCSFNIDNDDEKEKQNCTSTEDIAMSTKIVRSPLSPRNVKQTTVRLKGSVKIKSEHITSSPAGKSRERKEAKAMDESVTQVEAITLEVAVHCDNHCESEKNRRKSDSESKMDYVDISTSIDNQNEVVHEQQISETVVLEGHARDITGSQRDFVNTTARLPEMSTGDYSTLEIDTESCGNEKLDTASCGKEKLDTESHGKKKVAAEICGMEELDTGSCGTEGLNTKTLEKEKLDTDICEKEKLDTDICEKEKLDTDICEKEKLNTDICEKEKLGSGSNGMGKPDIELHEKENLDTELCRMEKLDTWSCKSEKVDSKSHGMEKLDSELCGMEKLDTGLCRIGKPDRLCKTEKLDTESHSMEKRDPESFEMEKLDTKPHGKEKLDTGSFGTDKLDTLNIEMDEKETSSVIDEECGKILLHYKEESKECLTKSSKQQLDLNDSGKDRLLSADNLLNKAVEDDSAGNRKRSASSVQSDSTLESDLEMSSDSESEESGEKDRVRDSETFHPSDIKTDASHEDKPSHDLNNSVVSHTSEAGSDGDVEVHCSTDEIQSEDLNDKGFGHCSPKQDGSHTPKQISSGMLKQSEEHTGSEMHKPIGSQKPEQNDLQTPDKNQDIYEEDLDYEYESDSSSLSSDQQGGGKSSGNNNELLLENDEDLTEEFSELNTGAEDSQDDELMICVSPSESMEFETEENIEEGTNESAKIKKSISPKKKILCSRSKQEGARTSASKQKNPGSLVSRQISNDRKDHHKQSERNPSHECSKLLHSKENNGNRSNKKDSLDNHSQKKSESYGTYLGAKTSYRSRHNYTDDRRLKERERKDKMSAQKKHKEHTERMGKNHDSPRTSKDHERKRLPKDRHSDREKTSKDRHSDMENKDRHSGTERTNKNRHSDMERTNKDRHSGTERTNKDGHRNPERTNKDRHSDTERTNKDRHSDTERTNKDGHSDPERTNKDGHSDPERTSKDRPVGMERAYKDCHDDIERTSKDRHGETERTSKDRHGDNYRERLSRDHLCHKERINKDKEKKFKEQLSVHQRSSQDHFSEKKRTLKSNQHDQEGKTREDQTEDEGVSKVNQNHQKSQRESSKKTLSSKHEKTSEKKAMRKTARNLEHKYESPKILRTVTSETIFCAEGSHKMTDTMELYDEPKSAGVDNPSFQGAENITISHTDQGGEGHLSDDSEDRDRLNPVLAKKWSTRVCETSQHNIVNITRIDSDEEDMEIRVTDSSNSCSDDFLSDVSEPEKCARVRTWQEVAKIFREKVDILDIERVKEPGVQERSDNEDCSSYSDSDTSGDEKESDDCCYALESNYTFELCKNPETISDGEDVGSYAHVEPREGVGSYAHVEPREGVGSYAHVEPKAQTVCNNAIKSPDQCLLNPPEIYNDNASDNFTDSLDDRFHNCPTNFSKKCVINEESLEEGEILTDSEQKVETIPYGIKSGKKSSRVGAMLSHGKNVNKSDKHGRPQNIGKSKHHGNRSDKRSSERPLISPRPSPRKGRSPRDEMYRRKHLQTAVKVLQNRSRERNSHTVTGTSPVKVPRHGGIGNIDGTDFRNRIEDKPSRSLEHRLPLRKRKRSRSRSCEKGSRIKHVSPRRS